MKTNEDRLSDLLFQLSNADRRRIIEELQKESLKLNEVAKKLNISATEAFRQLQRLTDSGLLEKIPDGKYRFTPYSKLTLESLAALDFLSQHREYFSDHDTSLIPPQFRARFGELSKTVLLTEMVPNINTATEVLKNAKWVNIMSEQRLEQHGQIIQQRILKEGMKVRTLMQESLFESIKGQLIMADSAETRYFPRICAVIVITDKSAGISFPTLDGKIDYQVFVCNDPDSRRWASDLFEDQWSKAKIWHP